MKYIILILITTNILTYLYYKDNYIKGFDDGAGEALHIVNDMLDKAVKSDTTYTKAIFIGDSVVYRLSPKDIKDKTYKLN